MKEYRMATDRRWLSAVLTLIALGMALPVAARDYPISALSNTMVGDAQVRLKPGSGSFDSQYLTITRPHSAPLTLADIEFERVYAEADPAKAPNLILRSYSGGAHCCYTLHVITFVPALRVQSIPIMDSENIRVYGPQGDVPRLQFWDSNFGYWGTSFASSPAAQVTLAWNARSGRYEADIDAMHQSAPADSTLNTQAQALSKVPTENPANPWPPVALWARMLDLVYSGNSTAARTLVDRAWQPGWGSKAHFLGCFSQQLNQGWVWVHMDLGEKLGARGDFATPHPALKHCPQAL